jgi:hypothetical protein
MMILSARLIASMQIAPFPAFSWAALAWLACAFGFRTTNIVIVIHSIVKV